MTAAKHSQKKKVKEEKVDFCLQLFLENQVNDQIFRKKPFHVPHYKNKPAEIF